MRNLMSYFYYTYSIGSENRSVHRLFDASIDKAVASTLKVVRPESRCGCSRKWVWSCKEVGMIEETR